LQERPEPVVVLQAIGLVDLLQELEIGLVQYAPVLIANLRCGPVNIADLNSGCISPAGPPNGRAHHARHFPKYPTTVGDRVLQGLFVDQGRIHP
jgi:hypothetical protein